MHIEIKEIELDSSLFYIVESYPESGIYIVKGQGVMMVNKVSLLTTYLCTETEIKGFASKSNEAQSGITESLFLKTLAVIANKEKPSEL